MEEAVWRSGQVHIRLAVTNTGENVVADMRPAALLLVCQGNESAFELPRPLAEYSLAPNVALSVELVAPGAYRCDEQAHGAVRVEASGSYYLSEHFELPTAVP